MKRHDSTGNHNLDPESSEVSEVDYLNEIKELVGLWTRHRSGDLETLVERFSAIGTELNRDNYYDSKINLIREKLNSLTDKHQRIELRFHVGKLLKEKGLWGDAEIEFRHVLSEVMSIPNQEMRAQTLNELTEILPQGKTVENTTSPIPADPKQ